MPSTTPRRTKLLRLLKGLHTGRLDFESVFAEFPVQKFSFFRELPGYIEKGISGPVSAEEFHAFARIWPQYKLLMKLSDTPSEELLNSIRKKLENENPGFKFLKEFVPHHVQKAWKESRTRKAKHKEETDEKRRIEAALIAEKWATLHPLNQEWGIPPPPTFKKTSHDQRITDWVHRYLPYMYECNGYLLRKITKNKHDSIYEQSYKDHTFHSDREREKNAAAPAQKDVGVEAIQKLSEAGRAGPAAERPEVRPVVAPVPSNLITPVPSVQPIRINKVSDTEGSVHTPENIKRISDAMRTWWK